MADEDETEFANYLADLLEHHAGQVSDVQVEPRGTSLNIQRAQPADQLVPLLRQLLPSLQNLKDVGAGVMGPPKTPEEAGQRMGSIGEVAPWLAGGAVNKGVGALGGVIKQALSNPQNLKRILGSIAALAGTTTPALGQKAPAPKVAPQAPPPQPLQVEKDEYEAAKDLLRSDIKDIEDRIEKLRKSPQMMSGGARSYNRRTGEVTYGEKTFNQAAFDAQTKDDRLLLASKNNDLHTMEYNEKTFREKNQWFLPATVVLAYGLGHGISNQITKSIVRKTGEIPKTLERWLLAGETGTLGILDALGQTSLPYMVDKGGVGRAKKEADRKTTGDLALEFAEDAGLDFTSAFIGGKTGLIQGGRDKNVFASPAWQARTGATKDIISQLNQIDDLRRTFGPRTPQAPAALAPPVAAPPAAPQYTREQLDQLIEMIQKDMATPGMYADRQDRVRDIVELGRLKKLRGDAPDATSSKPPRPRWHSRGYWADTNKPGNPKLKGWENVPPPSESTAANPQISNKKIIPRDVVIPNIEDAPTTVPNLLRKLGRKPPEPE